MFRHIRKPLFLAQVYTTLIDASQERSQMLILWRRLFALVVIERMRGTQRLSEPAQIGHLFVKKRTRVGLDHDPTESPPLHLPRNPL